jgi:hypothetical protein
MPNLPYLGDAYPVPLDPAYADIWGDILNAMFVNFDAAIGKEQISGFIVSVANQTYIMTLKMRHAGTITSVTTICESGTCTATVKVNSTALGGTANSVSSVEQTQAHVATNTFVAGDDINLVISSNSSCRNMAINIWYSRTDDGTA